MKHNLEPLFIDHCELLRNELQQKVNEAAPTVVDLSKPVTFINSQDICLDDLKYQDQIINLFGKVVSTLAEAIIQQPNRTIKSVVWLTISDKNCAIDATIGFFRVELAP